MYTTRYSIAGLTAVASVLAGEDCGHATVVNKCPYDVYLWSVAWDMDGPYKIGCGEAYIEKYIKGGVALEIVKDKKDWYDDCNKLILYYKLSGGNVYYDMYDKHGHPFEGTKIELKPEYYECPKIEWDDGCGPEHHGKECCQDQSDLVLHLCDGEYHQPKPPNYPPKPPAYPPEPPEYPPQPPYPPYETPDSPPKSLGARNDAKERGNEDVGDWHLNQWEHDKPDWDFDAKCTTCGTREKGYVAMFDLEDAEEVD